MIKLKEKVVATMGALVIAGSMAVPTLAMAASSPNSTEIAVTNPTVTQTANPTVTQAAGVTKVQKNTTNNLESDTENIKDADHKNQNDAAEQATLKAQAKIDEATALSAVKAALGANTIADIAVDELDNHNGTVVYEIKGTDVNGKRFEARVDAITGKVLQTETGDKDHKNHEGHKGHKGHKEHKEQNDPTEQAALKAQAKIDETTAINAVKDSLGANTIANIAVDELDGHNGTVVYEIKGTDVNGKKFEARVDAVTGKVLQTESGDEK